MADPSNTIDALLYYGGFSRPSGDASAASRPDIVNALAQTYAGMRARTAGRNALAGGSAWPTLSPLPDNRPSLRSYDPYAGRPMDWAERSGVGENAGLAPLRAGAGLGEALGRTRQMLGDQDWHGAAETALPLAAMAFMPRARQGTSAHGYSEWPVQAALKLGDHIFPGETHYDALRAAQARLGDHVVDGLLPKAGDGFLTNTGRYVTREEAGALADAINRSGFFAGKKGKDGFISEALDAYDPKTGQQIANPLEIMGLYEAR